MNDVAKNSKRWIVPIALFAISFILVACGFGSTVVTGTIIPDPDATAEIKASAQMYTAIAMITVLAGAASFVLALSSSTLQIVTSRRKPLKAH